MASGCRPGAAPASRTSTASAPATSPVVAISFALSELLGETGGWELFGRGPGSVVRLQIAEDRITRRTGVGLGSGGPVSFVVGSNEAVIRPLDDVPGYAIPDGKPPRNLTGELGAGGLVLPGPDPDDVWLQTGEASHASMTLVGLDGRPSDTSIPIPAGFSPYPVADGAGYLLLAKTDGRGVYDARPGMHLRRVTTGEVLAVADLAQQQFAGRAAELVLWLRDRGERHRRVGRDRDVVVADDADVAGHVAGALQDADRADRQQVVGAEQGVQVRSKLQSTGGGLDATGDRHDVGDDLGERCLGQAGALDGPPGTTPPVGTLPKRPRPVDHHELRGPAPEQVLDRELPAMDVVDRRRAVLLRGNGPVDEDHTPAPLAEPLDPRRHLADRVEQHPGGALLLEHLQVPGLADRVAVAVAQHDDVSSGECDVDGTAGHLAEERLGDVGDDQADQPAVAPAQFGGR